MSASAATTFEIGGRCALYKAAQARVVRWLISTTSPASTSEYVDSEELLRLGRQAANTAEIPHNILELLREVIVGRRFCADWYGANSDQGHQQFIEVLEDLYDVLKAGEMHQKAAREIRLDTPASKSDGTATGSAESLANIFAQLSIEEPSASPLGHDDHATRAITPTRPSRRLQVDPEQEKKFEFCCFVQDLNEIRKQCLSTWQQYYDGDISFLVASMVTCTAFSVMRQKETELSEIVPELKEYDMGVEFLRTKVRSSFPDAPTKMPSWVTKMLPEPAKRSLLWLLVNSNPEKGSRHISDAQLEEIHSKLLRPSTTVEEFKRGMRQRETADSDEPVWVDSSSSDPDPTVHYLAVSLRDAAKRLRASITLLRDNPKIEDFLPLQDLYLREFFYYVGSGKPPVWFLFATQLYMDVYDLLGVTGALGIVEMAEFFRQTNAAIPGAVRTCKTSKYIPPSTIEHLKWYKETNVDRYAGVPDTVMDYLHARDNRGADIEKDYDMARAGPVYASLGMSTGFLLNELLIWRSWTSMDMINEGAVCLVVAHLYKALRHYGLLCTEWKDMEWFIRRHSRDKPLIPELPSEADDTALARRFLVSMGASAITAREMTTAPSGRAMKRQMRQRWTEVRIIDTGSEYFAHFTARVDNDRALRMVRGDVHPIVLNALHEKAVAAQKKKGNNNRGQHATDETARASSTGTQIVEFFKEHLLADELELQFNYLDFWRVCAAHLDDVRKATLPLLPDWRRKIADNWWHTIGMLLMDAADHKTAAVSVSQSALGRAAEVLQPYIEQHGDAYIKAATEKCSGGIPEDMKPCIFIPKLGQEQEEVGKAMETRGFGGIKEPDAEAGVTHGNASKDTEEPDGSASVVTSTLRAGGIDGANDSDTDGVLLPGEAQDALSSANVMNSRQVNNALANSMPSSVTSEESMPVAPTAAAAPAPALSVQEAFAARKKKGGKKLFRNRKK